MNKSLEDTVSDLRDELRARGLDDDVAIFWMGDEITVMACNTSAVWLGEAEGKFKASAKGLWTALLPVLELVRLA